jgi:hypothetical protein
MGTTQNSSAPASLAELFTHYLQRQASASAAGLGFAEPGGEVQPFEALPAQPIDPRVAWDEALAVVPFVNPKAAETNWPTPPDWPTLVAGHEPVVALPFCFGNYPQLVRDLQPLLHPTNLAAPRGPSQRPVPAQGLQEWASQLANTGQSPQLLLAVAALRLAKQFDSAVELVLRHQRQAPAVWRLAWANEEAALAWHSGRTEEARALWLAQAPAVPILFNQGMTALFLGQPAEARTPLRRAAEQIPEQSGWHHLAHLYLALADSL